MLTEITNLDTPLFSGIKKEDMGAMLSCTGYHISDYAKAREISQMGRELMKEALDRYEISRQARNDMEESRNDNN